MPQVDVLDRSNKKVGTVNLSDSIFARKVNIPLVHQVIKAQLAGRRQGTASTKTRGEVNGTTKKIYKQKGTGNARHGAATAPIFVGGGTAFGPKPRSYAQKTPKKMITGALCSALSDRLNAKRMLVIDKFDFSEPKTKDLSEVLTKNFQIKNALIVDADNPNLQRSGKNIPNVTVLPVAGLNVYDIVKHDWIMVTKGAVEALEARYKDSGTAGGKEDRGDRG